MVYNEESIKKLIDNYNLLCNVINQSKIDKKLKVDLSSIEEIIQNEIPETLKKNAPDDFYQLYMDFKMQYEQFKNFILYDKLIGKNIVSLGGGFSSGKSSFLNSFMGKSVLPNDIDPSTSVPTYILSGEQHDVMGMNIFGARVKMEPRDIKRISHSFGEIFDDDDEKIMESTTLGHILETIFFSTPLHKYKQIAFLDTPGYSKPDSEEYTSRTDEQISRGQLNASTYILWFVQADAGTITDEDINFIKTLEEDINKIIIVNKADKKNIDDLKEIINSVKENLNKKGVIYKDVIAFSSRMNQIEDRKLESFLKDEQERLIHHLNEWGSKKEEFEFAKKFKKIFVHCKRYYEDKIDEESSRLERLNTTLTKLAIENIDFQITEQLQNMVRITQNHIYQLKKQLDDLTQIQKKFFIEIKRISDEVGILMPEPSEVEFIEATSKSPLEALESYMALHEYKENRFIMENTKEFLCNITPNIKYDIPGSQYQKIICKQLNKFYQENELEEKINNVYYNIEKYIKCINNR